MYDYACLTGISSSYLALKTTARIWTELALGLLIFSLAACSGSSGNNGADADVDIDADTDTDSDIDTTLRGYFCEDDLQCGQSEECAPLSDGGGKICRPRGLINFIDDATFTVDTSNVELVLSQRPDGSMAAWAKGFSNYGSPGDPDLPSLVFNVLLPPDADPKDMQVRILSIEEEELAGEWDIGPAGPAAGRKDLDGVPYEEWFKDTSLIVDGRNSKVYESDGFWPDSPIRVSTMSQMRRWKFVKAELFPFRYDPKSGKIKKLVFLKVHVEVGTLPPPELGSDFWDLQADTAADIQAAAMFANFGPAATLYKSLPVVKDDAKPEKKDYIILTTNAVRSSSKSLAKFVAHKESIGYKVAVVTEDDYGKMEGRDGPEKARNWLKANYARLGAQFLLILADPNDTDGPAMRTCWPRFAEKGKDDWERTPTDAYYADLTGNWDLDNDGIWCEFGKNSAADDGDMGPGGIDLTPELHVGRIPVYANDTSTLDEILERTIAYETQQDTEWRRSVLLPEPISDYAREEDHTDDGGWEVRERGFNVDAAVYGERMKSDFLKSSKGFKPFTLYEKRGPGASKKTPDQEFTKDNVLDQWKKGYGIISWWAHGNSSSAAAKVWEKDTNNDGIAQRSEKRWEDFAYVYTSADRYNPKKPAFTVQVSCLNSRPDRERNLSYDLLKKGAAIATLGATSVTLYSPWWSYPRYSTMDNVSIGYYLTQYLARNFQAGRALSLMRSKPTSFSWGDGTLMNILSFNLFGDPSLAPFTTYKPAGEPAGPEFQDRGHAFDPAAESAGVKGLLWKLQYSLDLGRSGSMSVHIEVLDKNGDKLAKEVSLTRTFVIPEQGLTFDGDSPDIYFLTSDSLSFLEAGRHDLSYQITFSALDENDEKQVLYKIGPVQFTVEVAAETSQTIEEGKPVTGTLEAAGDSHKYVFTLSSKQSIQFRLTGPDEADFDLHVTYGVPGDADFVEKKSERNTSAEEIMWPDAEPGNYFIEVYSYSGTGSYSLEVSSSTSESARKAALDELVESEFGSPGEKKLFLFQIPEDGLLDIILDGSPGSRLQVLVRRSSPPTDTEFDAASSTDTDDPEINTFVTSGDQFVLVKCLEGSGKFQILASLSPLGGDGDTDTDVDTDTDSDTDTAESRLVINELHYDTPGQDTTTFIELVGTPGSSLDGCELDAVNGNNGETYSVIVLSGQFVRDDGFFVVAQSADVESADLITSKANIQNGPDNLLLFCNGELVDAVGYEYKRATFSDTNGFFAGEGSPASNDTPASPVGRCPDGKDTGDNSSDFRTLPDPTPGAFNACD